EKNIKDIEELEENKETKKEDSFLILNQKNLYDFMRKLLIKRFESSFGAFYSSLENFIKVYKSALNFAERTGKFILDRDLMEKLYEKDDEEILKEIENYQKVIQQQKANPEFYKVYDINSFERKEEFFKDIESDIKLFEYLKGEVEKLGLLNDDPKAERLVEEVEKYIKEKRKVVIFTEYIDTAKHLKEILEKKLGSKILSV
ncbi:hypothetical protein, partial [Nocardia mangyaensis]|uniref:hypothetical protein n=1 Tax=Nocardia mangyaensis TaxID=2213200 RepID=UPI002676A27F